MYTTLYAAVRMLVPDLSDVASEDMLRLDFSSVCKDDLLIQLVDMIWPRVLVVSCVPIHQVVVINLPKVSESVGLLDLSMGCDPSDLQVAIFFYHQGPMLSSTDLSPVMFSKKCLLIQVG